MKFFHPQVLIIRLLFEKLDEHTSNRAEIVVVCNCCDWTDCSRGVQMALKSGGILGPIFNKTSDKRLKESAINREIL